MKRIFYIFLFFISVFFKLLLNKTKAMYLSFLVAIPVFLILLYNGFEKLSYGFVLFCIIAAIIYFIIQTKKYWLAIKGNEIITAKVKKFESKKRASRNTGVYYIQLMDYEYEYSNKKYDHNDFALMKIKDDKKEMWKFDKEANKKGLSEKEMIENYESEFDIYVLEGNPEIHVFKEYNLHKIYLKATT